MHVLVDLTAQSKNRETIPQGIGWELFLNYLIAKEKYCPDFFLYENNKSAAPAIKDSISEHLRAPLQYINSALVSAQNRQRFYCHNFGDVPQPEDRGIVLADIIESGMAWRDKAYALTTRCADAIPEDTLKRHRHTMVTEPVRIGTIENAAQNQDFDSRQYRIYSPDGKSITLCGNGGGVGAKTGLYVVPVAAQFEEANYDIISGADIIVTDRAIRQGDEKGTKQGKWVYLPGADKTNTISAEQAHNEKILVPLESGTPRHIYPVRDGLITIKGKQYPVKLPDGDYIIRKLTVTECCRLQTLRPMRTEVNIDLHYDETKGALCIDHQKGHALYAEAKCRKLQKYAANAKMQGQSGYALYAGDGIIINLQQTSEHALLNAHINLEGWNNRIGFLTEWLRTVKCAENHSDCQNREQIETFVLAIVGIAFLSERSIRIGEGGSAQKEHEYLQAENGSRALNESWNAKRDGASYAEPSNVLIKELTTFITKYPLQMKLSEQKMRTLYYFAESVICGFIQQLTSVENISKLRITFDRDYTWAVSNSQAYKGLGNGWTAEVIIHLLRHALRGVPTDTPIEVLSMYDGIGTGRYCFDKLGYHNIKYYAYEIDKYAIQVAQSNYPDIVQCGDAFAVRDEGWTWQ